MPEEAEPILSDEEILERTEVASEEARVSPLDLDFILVLTFAFIVDAIDIILEWFSILVLPKLILIIIDIVVFFIIGGWIYWRTKKIIQNRREFLEGLSKKSEKMTQQIGKLEKQLLRSPFFRALIRGGLAFLGELLPYIGLIPFWTISVVLTLREK